MPPSQVLFRRFFASKHWPLHLSILIVALCQVLTALLNTVNSLIWWGYVNTDLLWIGVIDALIISLLIPPAVIYMIRDHFSLEEMNLKLQQEIDRRTELQISLEKSEQLFQKIMCNSRDVIWMIDMNLRFTFVSPSVQQMLGYSPEEVLRMHPKELLSSVEQFDGLLRELALELELQHSPQRDIYKTRLIETEQIRKDASRIWVEISMTFMRDASQTPMGILGFSRDITLRKRADEELRRSKERYELLFNSIHDVVYSIDRDLRISSISPSVQKYLGYTPNELIGRSVLELELIPKDYFDKAVDETLRMFQGEYFDSEEYQFLTKDGKTAWAEVSGAPLFDDGAIIGTISVARDITARKEAEESRKQLELRLQRAEKMEALGLLAGGVAHDLNNALVALVGYAELMLMELPEASPYGENIRKIIRSGERAGAIVQDLLTLARRGVQQPTAIDLNHLISDTIDTPECRKILSDNPRISVTLDLSRQALPMIASHAHMNKTIMNLLVNAIEAMPEGGHIRIQTERRSMNSFLSSEAAFAPGEYAVVTISDEGMGIDESDLKHIFEPFYTKKVMGRSGTGLGLAVVWGTVKDHGGMIDVASEIGKGTTFTLYFPLSKESADVEPQVADGNVSGKGEWILVVDDEENQRNLASEYLSKMGYRVVTAASGEEAVAVVKQRHVNMVVLDMIMDPGIDGLETFRRIREIRPDQRAIVFSGYSESDRVKQVLALGAGSCLQKPYRLNQLAEAIRKELDRS